MSRQKETHPRRQARGCAVQEEQVNLNTLGNAICIGLLAGGLIACLPILIGGPILLHMGII